MSSIETILTRMMQESDFAEAVFTDAEKALAEYNATPEDYAVLKTLTRAEFEAQVIEGRKSMGITMKEVYITSYQTGGHG